MARGLWLAHMGLLTYWLHDRSPDHANTMRAVETLAAFVRWSNTVARIPGFGALRKQLLAQISSLFPDAQPDHPAEPEPPAARSE